MKYCLCSARRTKADRRGSLSEIRSTPHLPLRGERRTCASVRIVGNCCANRSAFGNILDKRPRLLRTSVHYENDDSTITKSNERLAFVRLPSHSVRFRMLCAFAASAGDLSTGLRPRQRKHISG